MEQLDLLVHPVTLSAVSGLIGALRVSVTTQSSKGWFAILLDILVGVILAVSLTDYLPTDKPLLALMFGLVLGSTGASLIDTTRVHSPKLLEKVLENIPTFIGFFNGIIGKKGKD